MRSVTKLFVTVLCMSLVGCAHNKTVMIKGVVSLEGGEKLSEAPIYITILSGPWFLPPKEKATILSDKNGEFEYLIRDSRGFADIWLLREPCVQSGANLLIDLEPIVDGQTLDLKLVADAESCP